MNNHLLKYKINFSRLNEKYKFTQYVMKWELSNTTIYYSNVNAISISTLKLKRKWDKEEKSGTKAKYTEQFLSPFKWVITEGMVQLLLIQRTLLI